MAEVGASTGSLQVCTWSPSRARPLPFTRTMVEPTSTLPMLVGGLLNVAPGGGRCGGRFCAMLFTVAAGSPLMSTSVDRPEVSLPENGSGVGVGTGPPGDGTSTMWMSVPVTGSPCRAAGCGMCLCPLSVELDGFAGRRQRRTRGQVDLLGFNHQLLAGLDLDLLGAQDQLAHTGKRRLRLRQVQLAVGVAELELDRARRVVGQHQPV